jgi:uncharacterized metal-binding protein (TIGR02443 family)
MGRFIAGAVCPECRAMDRLLLETVESGRRRRCVRCGYADTEDESVVPEPRTRLDTRGRPDTPATAVRIVLPAELPGTPTKGG